MSKLRGPLVASDVEHMCAFRTRGYDGKGWYIRVSLDGHLSGTSYVKDRVGERGGVPVFNTHSGVVSVINGNILVDLYGSARFEIER